MAKTKSTFLVVVNGSIKNAIFHQTRSMYIKYNFVFGPDWSFVTGIDEGISCTGYKVKNKPEITFNTLLQATFSSTNPYKWPQIIFSCYGYDMFGHDIIIGYGSVHIPTTPGVTELTVPMFVPQASSGINKLIGVLTGKRAEFTDYRVVGSSEGRDMIRVSTQGLINVKFNVIIKDLKKLGFDVVKETMTKLSEFVLPQHIFETEEPSSNKEEVVSEIKEEPRQSTENETYNNSEQIDESDGIEKEDI
uniref:B9 domain-containing protein 1 n=1 Tax=Parastrongyloides trichosuri TaxID=131310 RepID=A0A0N4ZYA2_PARTI